MNVAKVLETYKQSYKKEKDFVLGRRSVCKFFKELQKQKK